MGPRDSTTGRAAEAGLRILQDGLATPRRPSEESIGKSRGESIPPCSLAILDHVDASVAELAGRVRKEVPDATPLPKGAAEVYAWVEDNSRHLDPRRAQALEGVVYRQGLEHALLAGDDTVVRREPCPRCYCWSLTWRASARRAACLNLHCVDAGGARSVWTLGQVAAAAVARKTAACAT